MNIALRKLAMLEKNFIEQEEAAKINGYTTCPVDRDLQQRIALIMDKVRKI